jgi:hypothetical protein
MPTVPDEVAACEAPVNRAEQVVMWLTVAESVLAIVVVADLLSGRKLSLGVMRLWEQWQASVKRERAVQSLANRVVWEAIEIVETA